MITSISNISSSSVTLLFGASKAASTTSASTASKLLADATGHTDDALKTGNAIGNIIEIASRMKQDAVSADKKVEVEELDLPKDKGHIFNEFDGDHPYYGVKGTFTTTYHGNGARTEKFVGTAMGMTDDTYRQMTIDSLKGDQSTLRNRAALAAFENGTMQEIDIADLGFKTEMVRTTDYYNDGHAADRTHIDPTAANAFREQYTEMRDGVMYDKETGKYAALGQNGTKRVYYTW
ncbi:hypothetical protein [Agrobacterium tumefaciens]|uniref:hypothetical protein n=1 Tax=Agrobacterium tumefaciens TaxID=358 RepID=UPI000977681E|nr:hypothetical protein BV900_17140 [Agrobacterium tumefaciens]